MNSKRLGDFEIVRELGRGGMGIVYEARQRSLNRRVALKVLSSSLGMTSKAVIRFRREAETAAKLHHTNIVPIHATGEEDGTHYYAMELVDGPSLNLVVRNLRRQRESDGALASTASPHDCDSTIALGSGGAATGSAPLPDWVDRTLTVDSGNLHRSIATHTGEGSSTISAGQGFFDAIARMIADVADALDYAHSQSVVHRDMKPSNLLLSPDGRLSINDFGLARMLEQPGMTTTGEFMGSPLYMSPEQITAGRAPLDHRTDIYSLGATLYELLTLQPPFLGERRDQIIGQIMHKEPPPPRSVNRKIPVDLETICLKAMEKDPDRRYQTGADMAEDLRRFVNRFAIAAKRVGIVGRAVKWARRHPAVAVLLCTVLLIGLAAGGLAQRSQRAQQRVQQLELAAAKENALLYAMSGDFEKAEEQIKQAEITGAASGWVRLLRAQVAYYQGDFKSAHEHVEQALRLMPDSVAALGLQSITADYTGSADKLYSRHQRILEMEAEDFQDYLLKGMAETWLSPGRAVKDLNQAITLRPASPVARVIRAHALRRLAMNSGELQYARQAVEDASAARGFLPDNAMAESIYLLAQLVHANLLLESGDRTRREDILEDAARVAENLRRFPNDTNAVWARSSYFIVVGDDDAAHQTLCDGSKQIAWNQTYIASSCAMGWFDRKAYDKALDAFDRATGKNAELGYIVPIFLQMETAPDLQALVDGHIAAHPRRQNSSGFFEILDWATFRLVGDKVRAKAIAERWSKYRVPGEYSDQWQAVARYLGGSATVAETVAGTEGARFAQSYAYYVMAIDLLAEGDRQSAKKHFQASIDLKFFNLFSYTWSRSFLARLGADPTWPPWIPMRETGATRSMPER